MRRLRTSRLRMAVVLALVTLFAASALAQGRQGGRGRPGRPGVQGFPPGIAEARLIKEMPEEIGVDEETLAKLDKLVAETREEEEALQGQTVEARGKVAALLDQPRPDEKELIAAVGSTAAVARQSRELKVKTSLRVRALLTDEQLEKFMEIRKKALGRRRGGGRPGGGKPGGGEPGGGKPDGGKPDGGEPDGD